MDWGFDVEDVEVSCLASKYLDTVPFGRSLHEFVTSSTLSLSHVQW
jgi:hypothetical protein